jgi:hypothetical protein
VSRIMQARTYAQGEKVAVHADGSCARGPVKTGCARLARCAHAIDGTNAMAYRYTRASGKHHSENENDDTPVVTSHEPPPTQAGQVICATQVSLRP